MFAVRSNIAVEFVGTEALAISTEGATMYHLTAEQAAVVRAIVDGDDVFDTSLEAIQLVEAGVIESLGSGLLRRSVLTGAGAVLGGVIVGLSLPTAAMASSSSLVQAVNLVADQADLRITNGDGVEAFLRGASLPFGDGDCSDLTLDESGVVLGFQGNVLDGDREVTHELLAADDDGSLWSQLTIGQTVDGTFTGPDGITYRVSYTVVDWSG